MQLTTVTLEAKDVSSTVSYLSELLDLEIVALGEEEILLKNQKIEFKVVPGPKSKNKGNIVFNLSVDHQDDLLEIWQKAQFLHYRFGEKCSFVEQKLGNELQEIQLIDPDGRRWSFQTFH